MIAWLESFKGIPSCEVSMIDNADDDLCEPMGDEPDEYYDYDLDCYFLQVDGK